MASIEQEGQEIAQKLGKDIDYTGPQYKGDKFAFHLFTDKVTGTTFAAVTLEEAKESFAEKRKAFGASPPVSPLVLEKYPTHLTMSQYRNHWKPKGWRIIFIGPTSTWRQEWGTWEAIRDIVQNCLDEAEAYQFGYDDEGLWISDQGNGVAVADFLLGPPKLKPEWARGKFGEGMKIASLALLREGYGVRIETVGREILMVFLEQEVNGKVETLAALWKDGGTARGTTFHIVGYRGDAYAENFTVNLPKDCFLAATPSLITEPTQRYNSLMQLKQCQISAERLYTRDIYMRDFDSIFSYNLWGFEMAPDRFAPRSEGDMWKSIGRVWCCIDDPNLLQLFLKMTKDPPLIKTEETHNVDIFWGLGTDPTSGKKYTDIMSDNREAWKKAWNSVFGDNTVLRTSERWDAIVNHLGFTSMSMSVNVRQSLADVVKTDKELISDSQERLRDVKVIPQDKLTSRQYASLVLARAIVLRCGGTELVEGVHAAIIPPASDRVRTAGLYNRNTMEIFISSDQLNHGRTTVDTVDHELAHHTSGAEDGEDDHNREISRIAGCIVQHTQGRWFDKEVADPNFQW